MTGLNVENKELVVPGQVLAEGMDFLPTKGTFREGDKILASKVGLVRLDNKIIKLISLSGKYQPKKNDEIIGIISDVSLNGWRVNTNSAYSAMLPIKDATSEFIQRGADLTKYFDIGDVIITKIVNVTSQNLVDVSMKGPGLRKITGGRLIYVSPMKVPRMVGKQGSMIKMIMEMTKTKITIGQNGIIWVSGEPENEIKVEKTLRQIEAKAHLSGLTESIKEHLENMR